MLSDETRAEAFTDLVSDVEAKWLSRRLLLESCSDDDC